MLVLFFKMTTGLAIIGLIHAITIDNHLVPTKNDCYERLALGERLDSRDVYKSINVTTSRECQLECTAEEAKCVSLSFGIHPKGNGTCELSFKRIKETADLKPIGTKKDPDFDLYIKKVDCKLNIPREPVPSATETTVFSPHHTKPPEKPQDGHHKPEYLFGHQDGHRPQQFPNAYQHGAAPERPHYVPPSPSYGQHVPDFLPAPQHKPQGGHKGHGPMYDYDCGHNGDHRPGYHDRPLKPYEDFETGGHGKPYGPDYYRPDYDRPDYRPEFGSHGGFYGHDPHRRPAGADYGRPSLIDFRPNHELKPGYDNRPDYDHHYRPISPNYTFQKPLYNQESYGSNGYAAEYPPRPSNRPQQLGQPDYYQKPSYLITYSPSFQAIWHRPVHAFRPTYMVAVLDSHRPQPSVYNSDRRIDRPYAKDWDRKDDSDPDNPNSVRGDEKDSATSDGYSKDFNKKKPEEIKDDGYSQNDNPSGASKPVGPGRPGKPVIDVQPRPHGGSVTSIITEIGEPCFRRALPGKRVTSGFIKRAVSCERVEDCQRECAEEKTFSCEGFNYRLDPAGRVQGDCELTSQPMSQLDINRDIIPDPDYDYYEKDRNMDGDCRKRRPSGGGGPPSGGGGYGGGGGYDGGGRGGPYGGGPYHGGPYHGPSGGYDIPRPGGFDGGPRPGGPRPAYDDRPRPPGGYDEPRPGGYGGHGPSRPGGYDSGPRGPYPSNGGGGYADGGRPGGGGGCPPPAGRPSGGYDSGRPYSGGCPPESGRPPSGYPPDRHDYGPSRPDDRPPPRGGPYPPYDGRGPYPPSDHRPSGGPYPPSGGGGGRGERPGSNYPADHGRPVPVCPLPMPTCGGSSYPPSGGGGGGGGSGGSRYPPGGSGGHYPPPSGGGGGPYPPSGGGGGGGYRGGGYRPYDHGPKDVGYPRPPYHVYQHDGHYQPYNRRIDWRLHYPFDPYDRQRYHDAYYHERERDRMHWGIRPPQRWGTYGGVYGNFGGPDSYYGVRRNQNRIDFEDRYRFVPYRIGVVGSENWGQYGGSYGTGGYPMGGGYRDMYDYWGFNRHHRPTGSDRRVYHGGTGIIPASYGGRPRPALTYDNDPYFTFSFGHSGGGPYSVGNNHIGFEGHFHDHRRPPTDDCSMRSGMGFRLNKAIVKKFFAVPNIHECEKLCYTETEFKCIAFAYRYAITLSSPTDNCYLSDRSYKELDFYTDLEPDRDFDIYIMNNNGRHCTVAIIQEQSDCFIRVRSGQRLDHSVVKGSLHCRTIVDCQLECLNSKYFTCRAFSYRFGPSQPGGPSENCQLTDWPSSELDPRVQMMPAAGFELYERGSYGHGCESDHFSLGLHGSVPKPTDKICYIPNILPSRLLPEAAKGSLSVGSETDCKVECTRAREETKFPCMSFSYRSVADKGEPNCELSDIPQSDLLPGIDYARESLSFLFTWDNNNPVCMPGNRRQDTWSMYTVNGWPCKRGTYCQENREAGFWSCELEGGDVGSWDYCCRPDHKCGYSHGYSYPWCYVGPSRDQWRKCSDIYYPYNHYMVSDKKDTRPHLRPPSYDSHRPYPSRPSSVSSWHKEKPFRPPYYHSRPDTGPIYERPSLNNYEDTFNTQYLDPPKPGGFGKARHWPVSYLHKESPPNATADVAEERADKKNEDKKGEDKKFDAINTLMKTIKTNDLKSSKYQVNDTKEGEEEVLLVRLPMPDAPREEKVLKFDIVDTKNVTKNKNLDKHAEFDDLFLISVPKNKSGPVTVRTPKRDIRVYPVIRRGYVTRTNRTSIRRKRIRPDKDT